ncbi:MAG: hypothetical protein ACI8X5_003823 [Planctomycetota bacterium]|jgi:hypothetical protein
MSANVISWSWSPSAAEGHLEGAKGLQERLRESALDRTATSREVTIEAAQQMTGWLEERPKSWGLAPEGAQAAAAELEAGWAEWNKNHGWRATCSTFLDSVRGAYHGALSLRKSLIDELENWLACDNRAGTKPNQDQGHRLVDRQAVVPHALRVLERGETVLIHGYSSTLLGCLKAAQTAGLFPKVLVGLGAPDQSGKRMARELSTSGIQVRLAWDAAVMGAVASVDRIWLGTEAVGSQHFTGLVGTQMLLMEARRNEVPANILCTSDKLAPASEIKLPAWGFSEHWNLWSHGPNEVQIESQPYELVDASLVSTWITEEGPESLAAFCTRSLRTNIAAPCSTEKGL